MKSFQSQRNEIAMLGGYEKQQEYRQHLMNEKTGRSKKNKQCCTEKILKFFIGIEGYDFNGYQLEKRIQHENRTRIHRFFFEMIQISIS